MKKKILIFCIFLIVSFTFYIENCMCQWQADVRLTNNSSSSYVYSKWCVASSLNFVHVVWYDNRDGNYEIYYIRSTDGGINWGAETRLTNNTSASQYPMIIVSGAVLHIVWFDNRDGNYEIYYKRSTDNGLTWGADIRITNNSDDSYHPAVAVSNSFVHVVWYDTRDGNREIYYKNSTDGGTTWGTTDTRLTNNSADSWYPTISVSGSTVSVAWYDGRDGNSEIYYKRSTNDGTNWDTDTRLTNDPGSSGNACIFASNSNTHVVWWDDRDGNREIYYKRSTDNGSNWGADIRLTNNSLVSFAPIISVSGEFVHVVWYDNRDGNYEIYYKRSTDGGLNWEADTRLTNNIAVSEYPSVSVSGITVHVVWQDRRDVNYEIYYKRNPNGNIGIKNISLEVPEEFELGQNYPNPFNQSTMFNVRCSMAGILQVKVFDIMGREVETLVNEYLQPGTYEVRFDAADLPSGIYFYQLKSENYTNTKKLILIK